MNPLIIEKSEAQSKRLAKLRDLIQDAFAGVTLGNGVGLRESHALDHYEDQETCASIRACDEKQDWRSLSIEYITSQGGGMAFFDAEGMRFHLPAFLLADLETSEGSLVADYLSRLSDHVCWQLSLLSERQRHAVRAWLEFVLEDTTEASERRSIRRALEGFWSEPGEIETDGTSATCSSENPQTPEAHRAPSATTRAPSPA